MSDSSREVQVPMSAPDISEAEVRAVAEVMATPQLSGGPRIAEFERLIAERAGVAHAVAVSSGTSGLHLCAIAAGVGPGDLVVTSPFSFIASANCALYEGGVPVFVDIDPDTLNISPDGVADAVSDLARGGEAARRWLPPSLREGGMRGRLRAVIPVDVFGRPAEMDPITGVARDHGLAVIEDSCEAMGASYRGRQAGALGDAGVFAFYPNKQMTAAEGGVVVTSRDDWAALFRSLRNQGRDPGDEGLTHSRLGYNYRMTEMSAALAVVQLRRFDEMQERRERVAGWYASHLSGCGALRVPPPASPEIRPTWFVYVVRLAAGVDRGRVIAGLAEAGIPSRPYFPPIHLQPFYIERFGYRPGAFPVAEEMGRRCLALPFSGVMTEEQVERVCDRLLGLLGG